MRKRGVRQIDIAKMAVDVHIDSEVIPIAANVAYARINIGLGPNQAAVINKIRLNTHCEYEDKSSTPYSAFILQAALLRRTEGYVRPSEEGGALAWPDGCFSRTDMVRDEDVIYFRYDRNYGFASRLMHESDFTFDQKLLLIRDPQLAFCVWAMPSSGDKVTPSNHSSDIAIYYETIDLPTDVLTQLLVKDHS